MASSKPGNDGGSPERLGVIAEECLEAVEHLRRAVDYADKRDPFLMQLVAAMQKVGGLADEIAEISMEQRSSSEASPAAGVGPEAGEACNKRHP